ncbi:hypothetical protein Ga0466249_002083 [Sporomusaceae bacterium BoRhaA]|uniref:hypothetical protein n=1 Tax=Pelorhabdus rhamnosifermentans TaxID=2772457 RepID=UPI001C05FFC0|nr:hypothetical protein [Pelorhabdus rhamnosifermentans]MBU2700972.1 hypothetical protein [Pelorhabdus rhamnosifermentans]
MSDATVFSQVQRIEFNRQISKLEVEQLLKKFLVGIGEPLAYNGVILGHIKMFARTTIENDFLFLSLTRLNQVDVKSSPNWGSMGVEPIIAMELTINVLVFNYSRSIVKKVVAMATEQLASVSRVKVNTDKAVVKLHVGGKKISRVRK